MTTSSGSNALLLAINCLNLRPGDEVIMPTRTWIATAHAAIPFKLKIKLIDVNERALADINEIQNKITKKTKLIFLVHLGGRTCEVDQFKKICKINNIYLIEDAAQALMSKNKGKYVGTQSDIGCFSLGPSKILNTVYGGFVPQILKNFIKNYY